MKKILIADTIEIFREGLQSVIQEIDASFECMHIRNYSNLISAVTEEVEILILEHCEEFKAIQVLKSQIINKNTKVIIVSANNNKRDLKDFLKLNVYGYLLKNSTKLALKQTLNAVINQEKYFCPFVTDILLNTTEKETKINDLTERETEITRLISIGLKNKEIAEKLHLSPHTIHTHRKNILRKTGVSSALELSIYAKENGIA